MAEIMTATIRLDDERYDRLLKELKMLKRRVAKYKWQKAIEHDRHKQYSIVR